jgi:hypothetical protein
MSEKKSRVRELRKRRDELAASLTGLDKKRADTVQASSYMRARDRAGVTDHTADEMAQVGDDEAAAHAAMRDVRAEMHRLDAEIASESGRGLGARVGDALRRVRRRDR